MIFPGIIMFSIIVSLAIIFGEGLLEPVYILLILIEVALFIIGGR